MSLTDAKTKEPGESKPPACSVSSTFNFSVGAVAILVAIVVLYVSYSRWAG